MIQNIRQASVAFLRVIFRPRRRIIGWRIQACEIAAYEKYLRGELTRAEYLRTAPGTVSTPIYDDEGS